MKRCPFCGSNETMAANDSPCYVMCMNCMATGPIGGHSGNESTEEKSAVMAWNRRAKHALAAFDKETQNEG